MSKIMEESELVDKVTNAITSKMAFDDLTLENLTDILWEFLRNVDDRTRKEIKQEGEKDGS